MRPLVRPAFLWSAVIILMGAAVLVVYDQLPLIHLFLLALITVMLMYFPRLGGIGFGVVVLLLFVTGVFAAVYVPEGFRYPQVITAQTLYPGGEPYSWHLNWGKALVGYLLLFGLWQPEARQSWMRSLALMLAGVVLMLMLGLLLRLPWTVKWPTFLAAFAVGNLFVTVVAEESFFRLLIQQSLQRSCRGSMGVVLAVGFSALLFMAVHLPATWVSAVLIGGAGVIYAVVYWLSGRWLMAVMCHWLVNMVHLLFFPYP